MRARCKGEHIFESVSSSGGADMDAHIYVVFSVGSDADNYLGCYTDVRGSGRVFEEMTSSDENDAEVSGSSVALMLGNQRAASVPMWTSLGFCGFQDKW